MARAVIKAQPRTRQRLGNGNCHVDAASAQFIIGVDEMHTEMQQSMLVSLRHRMAREGEIGCYVGEQQREHSSSTYLSGHAEFNPPQILDRLLVAHASSTMTIIQAAHRPPHPPTTKIRHVKIKTA